MNVRYRVELSQTERAELTALVSGGRHAARKLKRAQILLAADAGVGDDAIARCCSGRWRRRYTRSEVVEADPVVRVARSGVRAGSGGWRSAGSRGNGRRKRERERPQVGS